MESKGVDKNCCRTWAWTKNCIRAGTQVRMILTEDELKHLIKRYDIDGDGCLSLKELKNAFQSLGSSFPAWRAWRALLFADANGDGYINEEELNSLVSYMVKHGYAKK